VKSNVPQRATAVIEKCKFIFEGYENLKPLLCKQVKWASILRFNRYLRGFFTASVENSARSNTKRNIKSQAAAA